jgi:hypothetical protein
MEKSYDKRLLEVLGLTPENAQQLEEKGVDLERMAYLKEGGHKREILAIEWSIDERMEALGIGSELARRLKEQLGPNLAGYIWGLQNHTGTRSPSVMAESYLHKLANDQAFERRKQEVLAERRKRKRPR